ncbi:MRPL2 [Candida theae]|uniref:Large ribosomal subunit protein bL27m n=1 Tax=Candida theae TaxID=1198502 RepID=A0AAD5BC92_9ASCO|nr:MRPL2 [Candida theae]KAI5952968.1 MRPL2 [Candida theae]
MLSLKNLFIERPVSGISSSIKSIIQIRTATKRVSGSKTNNKDSAGRRLGPKVNEGHPVKPGQIIMRQRGTKIHPGENVRIGVDHTIYAVEPGYVRFYFDPFHPLRKYVGVALKKDIRLPKEHFAPRLRRFGYVPIEDPVAAKNEELQRSRKEILALPQLEKAERKQYSLRKRKINEYKEKLAQQGSSVGLSEQEVEKAAERLFKISQFVELGQEVSSAQQQVTYDELYSIRLQYRRGELEADDFNLAKSMYLGVAKKVDNLSLNQ